MIADLRRAARSLRRTPAFSVAAFLTLSLGIGACAAVFSVISALVLAPLPYKDPDGLLEFWATASPKSDQRLDAIPAGRMFAWLTDPPVTVQLAARWPVNFLFRGGDEAVRVQGEAVTADYFQVLGLEAEIGRPLLPSDFYRREHVVVLTHTFWQKQFNADRGVIGRAIRLGPHSYTIVGVMPKAPSRLHFWVPETTLDAASRPGVWFGIARIRPGYTLQHVKAELQQRARLEFLDDSTKYAGQGVTVVPMAEITRAAAPPTLWILMGAAATAFLMGLLNLVNLFLVRSSARAREFAIHMAIGGRRWDLTRPLIVESVLLAGAGSLGALIVAWWCKDLVRIIAGGDYLLTADPTLDLRVLALVAALAVLTTVLIGLEPMRHVTKLDIRSLLQDGSGGTGARHQRNVRQALVALQIALTVMLAGIAGILVKAFRGFEQLDLGYDAGQVVVALPEYEESDFANTSAMFQLAEQARAMLEIHPQVESAAFWRVMGQSYPPRTEQAAVIEGVTGELHVRRSLHNYYDVSAGFFQTLGIAVVTGRSFTVDDKAGAPLVGVVTRNATEYWWPGDNPLGKRIQLGVRGPSITVVGVVETVAQISTSARSFATGSRSPMPLLFRPLAQAAVIPEGWHGRFGLYDGLVLATRSSTAPEPLVPVLRGVWRSVSPDVPLRDSGVLLDMQAGSFYGRQLQVNRMLFLACALFGFLLAVLGIYGVVTEAVQRRTKEIGIRMALGGRGWQITSPIANESLVTATAGLLAGLLLNVWVSKLFFEHLFWKIMAERVLTNLGTTPADPAVVALVASLALSVVLVATLSAAHRATRVDPVAALTRD